LSAAQASIRHNAREESRYGRWREEALCYEASASHASRHKKVLFLQLCRNLQNVTNCGLLNAYYFKTSHFYGSANNRQWRHYNFWLSIQWSVHLSVVCLSVNIMMQYLFTYWRDFNETCHKYSSCEGELLKRFSKSEVEGQSRVQMCECYNGRGIHFNGVASRLIVVFVSDCKSHFNAVKNVTCHICIC